MTRPTFLRVGVPKTKTRPPTTVRPPTSGGSPPSLDPLGWVVSGQFQRSATSVSVSYETGVAGDLIIALLHVDTSGSNAPDTPSGWTVIQNNNFNQEFYNVIYAKVADGTESGSFTFTMGGGTIDGYAATNRLHANGATLTTDLISVNNGANDLNPPSISLSGAESYYVLACLLVTSASGQVTGYPSGYTNVIDEDGTTADASMHVGQKLISSDGTEDPAAFTHDTATLIEIAYTVSIDINAAAATVAPADHDHVEADITDLDHWTEADHDALDHTGLTGVGGGVTDHGALTGLTDDDHTQYTKADGTRAFTGTVSGITPTADAHLATKGYVDGLGVGVGELLMQDGVTNPPVPLETEAQDDWLYEDNPDLTGGSSTAAEFSGALVYLTGTTQNIPDQTITAIEFSAEDYDSGSYWDSGSPTRLTVPTDGIYELIGSTRMDGEATFDTSRGNFRSFRFRVNGGSTGADFFGADYRAGIDVTDSGHGASAVVKLSANDYVELVIYQNSGETLTVPGDSSLYARMSIQKLKEL